MKKIAMILFVTAMTVTFVACQQTKKAEEVVETAATEAVEEVKAAVETPAAPEVKPAEVLKQFQAFAKEYADAYNNIAKNPVKYTQLAGQYKDQLANIEKVKDQLTPAQVKAYEKAVQIIKDVNSGGTKK